MEYLESVSISYKKSINIYFCLRKPVSRNFKVRFYRVFFFRRVPPYSSGPLPTPTASSASQPPSLGLPIPMSSASVTSTQTTSIPGGILTSLASSTHYIQSSSSRPNIFASATSTTSVRPSTVLSNTLPSPRRRAAAERLNGVTSKEEGERPSGHHNVRIEPKKLIIYVWYS